MKPTLGFNEIVKRTSLNLYTAQHVLKSAGERLGLPATGSQGVPRVFNLRQAVRFALAVKLTMAGVNVRQVEAVIILCEERIGLPASNRRPERPLYQDEPGFPWYVEIIEDDLVKLRKTQDARHHDLADPESYYSLSAKKVMNDFDHPALLNQLMDVISSHRINVTLLERMLLD
jgi:hypothetical protein